MEDLPPPDKRPKLVFKAVASPRAAQPLSGEAPESPEGSPPSSPTTSVVKRRKSGQESSLSPSPLPHQRPRKHRRRSKSSKSSTSPVQKDDREEEEDDSDVSGLPRVKTPTPPPDSPARLETPGPGTTEPDSDEEDLDEVEVTTQVCTSSSFERQDSAYESGTRTPGSSAAEERDHSLTPCTPPDELWLEQWRQNFFWTSTRAVLGAKYDDISDPHHPAHDWSGPEEEGGNDSNAEDLHEALGVIDLTTSPE